MMPVFGHVGIFWSHLRQFYLGFIWNHSGIIWKHLKIILDYFRVIWDSSEDMWVHPFGTVTELFMTN